MSIIDNFSNSNDVQIRVVTFSVTPSTELASVVSTESRPSGSDTGDDNIQITRSRSSPDPEMAHLNILNGGITLE